MADDGRRETLLLLFPDYDVDVLLASMTTSTAEQIADWCLNNPTRVPKKKRAEKRKAPTSPKEAQQDSDSDLDFDDIADGLLLDRLIKEMLNKLKKELSMKAEKLDSNEIKYFIGALYPRLRMDFIKHTMVETGYRLVPALIIGFFVYNKLADRVRDSVNNPGAPMWIMTDHLNNSRKKNTLDIFTFDYSYYPRNAVTEIEKFKNFMKTLNERYPQIIKGLTLLPQAFTLKLDVPDNIEKFTCGVCFDEFTVTRRITCGGPDAEGERHSFCRGCVKGQAKAATEDMPLAEGSVGLKCMDFNCKAPILYSAVRSLIPKKIRKRMDERIMEENISNSGLNLERCRECNFAMEMEETKEQNKVFACQNCAKEWCRLCEREWNDDHFGLSCAEVDEKNNVDKRQRDLERRLNEAVIRKCKCGLQFTKTDGCNKMTCRCRNTMCYICKMPNITYAHFCQHIRNPGVQECQQCDKKCTLWQDASQIDQIEMNRIREEVGEAPEPIVPANRNPIQAQLEGLQGLQNFFQRLPQRPPPPAIPVAVPPPHIHRMPDPYLNLNFNHHQGLNLNVNINDNNMLYNYGMRRENPPVAVQIEDLRERFGRQRERMEAAIHGNARDVYERRERERARNAEAERLRNNHLEVYQQNARRLRERLAQYEQQNNERRERERARNAEAERMRNEEARRQLDDDMNRRIEIFERRNRQYAVGMEEGPARQEPRQFVPFGGNERPMRQPPAPYVAEPPVNRLLNYMEVPGIIYPQRRIKEEVLIPEPVPAPEPAVRRRVRFDLGHYEIIGGRNVEDVPPAAVSPPLPPNPAVPNEELQNRLQNELVQLINGVQEYQNELQPVLPPAAFEVIDPLLVMPPYDNATDDIESVSDISDEEEFEEIEENEDLDILVGNHANEDELIDLTMADDEREEREDGIRQLDFIRDEGERYEVMAMGDFEGFEAGINRVNNGFRFLLEQTQKLKNANNKLRESLAINDLGDQAERSNELHRQLDANDAAADAFLAFADQYKNQK